MYAGFDLPELSLVKNKDVHRSGDDQESEKTPLVS